MRMAVDTDTNGIFEVNIAMSAPHDHIVSRRVIECTCERPLRRATCRCTCFACGGKKLWWVEVGHYLDKDLVCRSCGYVQDIWDC